MRQSCNLLQTPREESQGDTGHLLQVSRESQCLVFEGFLSVWELLGSPCSAWDTQRTDPALPFLFLLTPSLLPTFLSFLSFIFFKT